LGLSRWCGFLQGLVVLRVAEAASGCEGRRLISALSYQFAWVAALAGADFFRGSSAALVEWGLWAKGTALALDFGAVAVALPGLPLAGADFFRGFSAALVEWRFWAKGTALALDFSAVVAALLGVLLVRISSGALLHWWSGFGLRGRRLRLISALLLRLCLGCRWCRFLQGSAVVVALLGLPLVRISSGAPLLWWSGFGLRGGTCAWFRVLLMYLL
jgi:hypothetical protein